MAKKKQSGEEEIEVFEASVANEQVAATEEQQNNDPAVEEVVKEAPKKPSKPVEPVVSTRTKTVRVLGLRNHSCRIAGVPVFIEKHKEQDLPEHVAAILAHSLIVMRK